MEEIKRKFRDILDKYQVKNGPLKIEMKVGDLGVELKTLTPEEAIGNPEHDDYPLLKGKEKLMMARFGNGAGVAFVDQYGNFNGTLDDVMRLPLTNNFERGILVATINAVLNHLGLIGKTIHCRDDGPVKCSLKLRNFIRENYGFPKILQVGYQPRFAEVLSQNFPLAVIDRDEDNFGKKLSEGVMVESSEKAEELLDWAELVFATGSIFCNNTYPIFLNSKKPLIIYGVTGAGVSYLLGLPRYCEEGIDFKI